MIEFKLANHNLNDHQWEWEEAPDHDPQKGNWSYRYVHYPIIPGTKVCSLKALNPVGVVTHVGNEVDTVHPYRNDSDQTVRTYAKYVTVLWVTGKKKGKTEIKETKNLTNFDSYKASVQRHMDELNNYELEASVYGR